MKVHLLIGTSQADSKLNSVLAFEYYDVDTAFGSRERLEFIKKVLSTSEIYNKFLVKLQTDDIGYLNLVRSINSVESYKTFQVYLEAINIQLDFYLIDKDTLDFKVYNQYIYFSGQSEDYIKSATILELDFSQDPLDRILSQIQNTNVFVHFPTNPINQAVRLSVQNKSITNQYPSQVISQLFELVNNLGYRIKYYDFENFIED